jgi:flavin-binding protein dodecin
MDNPTYKQIQLTGSSGDSIEEAVNNALRKAARTVRNMRWLEVTEIRGAIDGDRVNQWQVSIKVGFRLEDD